jgi:hypothetical protein
MDPRNDHPVPAESPPPPLSTPLVWAGGGLLLTATMWLGSMITLFRALASLFH